MLDTPWCSFCHWPRADSPVHCRRLSFWNPDHCRRWNQFCTRTNHLSVGMNGFYRCRHRKKNLGGKMGQNTKTTKDKKHSRGRTNRKVTQKNNRFRHQERRWMNWTKDALDGDMAGVTAEEELRWRKVIFWTCPENSSGEENEEKNKGRRSWLREVLDINDWSTWIHIKITLFYFKVFH